jgi:hypothetical protein
MEWWWFAPAIFIAVASLTMLFIVGQCEKRPMKQFGPAMDVLPLDLPAYSQRLDAEAAANGLINHSVHKHVKHNITSMFWYSPARDILVSGGSGKIAGMPSKQTWVTSRLQNGKYLVTTDNMDEGDQSGLYLTKYMVGKPLTVMLQEHRQRLASSPSPAVPFTEPSSEEASTNIRRDRVAVLIQRGRARWRDFEQTHWSYTLLGAFGLQANWFKMMGVALSQTGGTKKHKKRVKRQ